MPERPASASNPATDDERTLYEAHPSMFRNDPIGFVVTAILCLVVVGIFMMLTWWLRTKGTTLTVTNKRTRVRRGILSKSITEVWHSDVRNVVLEQTFFQRIFGVGRIGISSAGQSGMEINVSGISDPERVKRPNQTGGARGRCTVYFRPHVFETARDP
jgi:uncharacterized membrane protein YdbT with pleckstrin-like domain